ncbi:MAG: hypothetical protein GY750_00305 [Lentisphaerae bacterium]|nr:hypothetical protein [Lentisphaerota bacterium]MCP4099861.1 hypothetical protein [Lentisphaerota bacterium]
MKTTTLLSGVAVLLSIGLCGCVYNCVPHPAAAPATETTVQEPSASKAEPAESKSKDSSVKDTKEKQEKLEPVTDEMRKNNEISFKDHRFVGFEMPSWMYSVTWDKLI